MFFTYCVTFAKWQGPYMYTHAHTHIYKFYKFVALEEQTEIGTSQSKQQIKNRI